MGRELRWSSGIRVRGVPWHAGRPSRDHHGVTQVEYGAACAASVEACGLASHFEELSALIAPLFSRGDLRSNAMSYLRGLLCPAVAGNCWAIAQAAGHTRPYRLQHLLSGAVWDEDAVRDAVRGFLARHLGPGGVLIFDETGDLKKGTSTAGAGRQYTGTAGRIENAIVAVYATYATELGHGLVDRDLYVQKEWFTDRERMKRAGFPRTTPSRPRPNWLRRRPNAPLKPGSHPPGPQATRSTGEAANYANCSRPAASATSSPSASTSRSPPPGSTRCAPTRP